MGIPMFDLASLFSSEEIAARKAEKIQPLIEEAERKLGELRSAFEVRQEELRQAQSAMDTQSAVVSSLYAERDTVANG